MGRCTGFSTSLLAYSLAGDRLPQGPSFSPWIVALRCSYQSSFGQKGRAAGPLLGLILASGGADAYSPEGARGVSPPCRGLFGRLLLVVLGCLGFLGTVFVVIGCSGAFWAVLPGSPWLCCCGFLLAGSLVSRVEGVKSTGGGVNPELTTPLGEDQEAPWLLA